MSFADQLYTYYGLVKSRLFNGKLVKNRGPNSQKTIIQRWLTMKLMYKSKYEGSFYKGKNNNKYTDILTIWEIVDGKKYSN